MSRVFIFILLLTSCNTNTKITLKGIEFGTTYSVQYFDNEQLDSEQRSADIVDSDEYNNENIH